MRKPVSRTGLELPVFDQPQKPSPCGSRWTYEQAVRAFEEIAAEWRLCETSPQGQPPAKRPFKP